MSRHVLRGLGATALSTALLMGSAAASAPPVTTATSDSGSRASAYSPTARAIFGRPGANGIRDAILANINNAPPGSIITGVTWNFTDMDVADALVAAFDRKVRVRILVSSRTWTSNAVELLQDHLNDTDHAGDSSFIRQSVGSARKAAQSRDRGSMHQKSWTFSRTGDAEYVSIVTSANVTDSTNERHFNDGYQFVDYEEVFKTLNAVFVEQIKRTTHAAPFRHVRIGPITSLTFSPWNSPTMADPVVRRINQIPAENAEIRVAIASFYGARGVQIARALAAKKRAGADVWVLHGRPFSKGIGKILRDARIPLENAYWDQGTSIEDDDHLLHSKMMTARYRAKGKTQRRVWTGSENWSANSTSADELVAMVGSPAAYRDYVAYFDSVWNVERSP